MSGTFTTHAKLLIAGALLVTIATATARAQASGAVTAEVITELEIEQRSRLTEFSTHKAPRRENVINELRNEKRRIAEAQELGMEVSDADIDEGYARMAARMRLTPEQLTHYIERSGINLDTIRHRIRADLAWLKYPKQRRPDP